MQMASYTQIFTRELLKMVALVLFILSLVGVVVCEERATLHSPSSPSSPSDCPLWTKWNASMNACQCGDDLKGVIVHCNSSRGVTLLKNCYCMTADNDKNPVSPLVGVCLYSCLGNVSRYYKFYSSIMPRSVLNITAATCGYYHRDGVMCGKCMENYGLPAYSYDIKCVKCPESNWLKYIAAAYIPLTIFCFIVIIFRLSATSGAVMGYVTVCQLISSPQIATVWSTRAASNVIDNSLLTFFSFWNLDFFRLLIKPFCLHPHLSVLQILALDYLTALYPMILIFLLYLFIRLHDKFGAVVFFCGPVYKCFHLFRREWEIKTSLVGTFATFYLFSYVKVLNISGGILSPTYFFSMDASHGKMHLYLNGSIPYFGKEHRPYAVLAITLVLLLNICPILLLSLYPCSHFHKCLNSARCRCQVLHIFMDAILGSYSHTPRERRYFGTLYLVIRVLHVTGIAILSPLLYTSYASYGLIITIVLVAYFRPHKNNWHNIVDIVLFSVLLYGFLNASFFFESLFVSPLDVYDPSGLLYFRSFYVVINIIFLYGVGLILFNVLPFLLIKKMACQMYKWSRSRCFKIKYIQLEESLPYRMYHSETEPLLK